MTTTRQRPGYGRTGRPSTNTALPRMTEKQLQEAVLHLARLLGWDAFHVYDSRRSARGYPDTTLVRPPRLIFAELKVGRRQLTPSQVRWLGRLGAIPGVECYTWREADWHTGRIDRILQ
jgi:hypothetical protein